MAIITINNFYADFSMGVLKDFSFDSGMSRDFSTTGHIYNYVEKTRLLNELKINYLMGLSNYPDIVYSSSQTNTDADIVIRYFNDDLPTNKSIIIIGIAKSTKSASLQYDIYLSNHHYKTVNPEDRSATIKELLALIINNYTSMLANRNYSDTNNYSSLFNELVVREVASRIAFEKLRSSNSSLMKKVDELSTEVDELRSKLKVYEKISDMVKSMP